MEFRLVAFFPHSVERENIVRGDQKTCEKDLWLAMELLIRPSRTVQYFQTKSNFRFGNAASLPSHLFHFHHTQQQSISDKLWPEFRYVLGYFRTLFYLELSPNISTGSTSSCDYWHQKWLPSRHNKNSRWLHQTDGASLSSPNESDSKHIFPSSWTPFRL